VLVLDADGLIVAANDASEQISGLALTELTSRPVREILTPESYALLLSHLENPGARFTANLELVHASGAPVPVEIHAARDESGMVQFTAREVPSQRRREEAQRHSETRFRYMAKNLTEMVLAYDMNRRLTFVNPAAATLTGYSPEAIEKAGFIDWIHPDDSERMLAYWDRLFEGTSFHEEEYRLVTRDGRVKWVSASWGPILDDQGRQVGVQGREREVTERHMAEETLRQSEQSYRLNEQRYRTLFEDSPFPMWEEDGSQLKRYLRDLRQQGVTDFRSHLD
jgi:PAS domain S-box-containing protein